MSQNAITMMDLALAGYLFLAFLLLICLISKTYHEALWADPDVPESEVQSAVANQYGITPEELSEIYGRVIDYNLKKYGSVTGNW